MYIETVKRITITLGVDVDDVPEEHFSVFLLLFLVLRE